MKLVVDTSILIDYLRGGTKWKELLLKVEEGTEFYLPTIVIFELFSGKSSADSRILNRITILLKYFQQIELSEDIAERAGKLYRDINKRFDVPDYIIAASALNIGGTVATLNRKHFVEFPGLELEDI